MSGKVDGTGLRVSRAAHKSGDFGVIRFLGKPEPRFVFFRFEKGGKQDVKSYCLFFVAALNTSAFGCLS
jgi:hypothetical protein